MPRVIVTTDQSEGDGEAVLLDELLHPVHLSTDHSARQFIERLGWAISDAEDLERAERQPVASALPLRRAA
jgi:hypothetical protein